MQFSIKFRKFLSGFQIESNIYLAGGLTADF